MFNREKLPQLTDRIQIGESGLRISPYCLGLVDSAETIPAAFDAGINFFFVTADMHWPLYEQTRLGLKMLLDRRPGIRDEIAIGVASYVAQPEFTIYPFLEVIEAIPGMERIDLAIVGGAYGTDFMSRLQNYEENRRKKSVPFSFTGATFHERRTAVSAINHNVIDLALIRYNPMHPGASEDVFPHISQNRKTLLFNFNNTVGYVQPGRFEDLGLGEDYWIPEITDYYRFALSRPEMDGLLISLKQPHQIPAFVEAVRKGPLEPEEENYLINLAALDSGEFTIE